MSQEPWIYSSILRLSCKRKSEPYMCRNKSVSHLHECRLSSEICNGRYISIGIDIRCTVNWWLFKWQYKSIYAGQHNWSNNSTGQCTQWRSVLLKVTRKTSLKPHVNIEVSWRQCEQVVWCLVCWFRNTSIVQISYTWCCLGWCRPDLLPSLQLIIWQDCYCRLTYQIIIFPVLGISWLKKL